MYIQDPCAGGRIKSHYRVLLFAPVITVFNLSLYKTHLWRVWTKSLFILKQNMLQNGTSYNHFQVHLRNSWMYACWKCKYSVIDKRFEKKTQINCYASFKYGILTKWRLIIFIWTQSIPRSKHTQLRLNIPIC